MRFQYVSYLFLIVLLSGCVSMLAGHQSTLTVYAPQVSSAPDSSWPVVNWDLSITKPSSTRMIDSSRILVRPTPNQLMFFHGIVWAQPAPELIEESVLHAFEDSARIKGVARSGTGISADYQLLMDIRRFEAVYVNANQPEVAVDLEVKLLDNQSQNIVGSRHLLLTSPITGKQSEAICTAFALVFEQLNRAVVSWTLTTGQNAAVRHKRQLNQR